MILYYGKKPITRLPPQHLRSIITSEYNSKILPLIKVLEGSEDPDEYEFIRKQIIQKIKYLNNFYIAYIKKVSKPSKEILPFVGATKKFLYNNQNTTMKKMHNANGEKVLIAQLSDEHLANIIHKNFSNIANALAMAEANPNSRERLLYGVSFNTDDLKHQIEKAEDYVLPYIFEANIRGMNITPLMQAVYGRKSALPLITDNAGNLITLPAPETIKATNGLEGL